MPLSGSFSPAVSSTPVSPTRTTTTTYQPSRSNGAGPAAPSAPIPLASMPPGPTAPSRAPIQQAEPVPPEGQEGQEGNEAEGPDAWRFAALARKDKAARERIEAARAAEAKAKELEAQLAERQKALDAEKARLDAEEAKRAEWRKNPAALLRDFGYNAEAALQFMLNGEKLTPEQQLAATVDAKLTDAEKRHQEELKALREETDRKEKERAAQAEKDREAQRLADEQAAIREFKAEIAEVIAADPEGFEILNMAGDRGVEAVFSYIDDQFAKTGKRVSVKDAAAAVEQAEIDQARGFVQRSKKLAALYGAPVARQPAPRTLSNRMPPAPPTTEQRPETAQQRRDRVKAQIDQIFAAKAGRR